MGIGPSSAFLRYCYGLRTTLARTVKMTPVKTITKRSDWGELERQLAEESSFDRLLEREEEMEAKTCGPLLPCSQPVAKGDAQLRWLQQALNRVSAFGIAENGCASIQTRRALQKFQAERGLRPTGTLGPKTRAALIQLSGIPAPQPRAGDLGNTLEAEMEAPSARCPADSPYVIRGFTQYSDDIRLLPPGEKNKLSAIAAEIARSRSGTPGVSPVTQVIVVGHADLDAARERREPGFLQLMSEKRALAVALDLACRVDGFATIPSGRGARALAIVSPRTESERACNRRAEVVLVHPSESLPHLDQDPRAAFLQNTYKQNLKAFYETALQGTSGQYPPPIAEQKAMEIAEKTMPLLKILTEIACHTGGLQGTNLWDFYLKGFFKDALQGTAQKYPTSDEVVSKAYEIAKHSLLVLWQGQQRSDWRSATLPQPMAADCEIVRGKVPGPANLALCGTHGHILDTTARTVIAHDLDEYKKQPRR
jgi:outer membrane protein OmpA-like peptidoglycan-associated protein